MILAIESSCDETALALFRPSQGTYQEWLYSQMALHQPFGGVVPDQASRAHLEVFPQLLHQVLPWRSEIESIAVTCGPGLVGCLAIGVALAKALGIAWKKPFYGVNHLHGHAYSPFMGLQSAYPDRFDEAFCPLLPHLGVLVSGGNTLIFEIAPAEPAQGSDTPQKARASSCSPRSSCPLSLRVWAQTEDDAAGEALDKGAKLLGMPYPGGPLLEQKAQTGDPRAFEFPRPFPEKEVWRLSFSGLKTSLRYLLDKMPPLERDQRLADLCASYQQAVVDQVVRKTGHILDARLGQVASLGLSGGVSRNQTLRAAFKALAQRRGLPLLMAQPAHTGDNASMIAFADWVAPSLQLPQGLSLSAYPALILGPRA